MKILDALLVLKEQAVTGGVDKPSYGICYNLFNLTDSINLSLDFVADNCEDWEHFSGDVDYPIEGYNDDCDLWEGEQLELRLSLLDHLITKAKQSAV